MKTVWGNGFTGACLTCYTDPPFFRDETTSAGIEISRSSEGEETSEKQRTKAARQSCQLHAIGLDFCFKIPSLMPHMIESQVMVFCRVLFFGWFFWCHRLQNPFFATFLALLQVRKVIESWMSSTPDRTKFSSKKFTARIDINWDWISSCFSSMCFIYHSISWFVSVISHFGITYLLFWGLFFLFIRIASLLEACSSNKAKHLEFSGPKNQPEDCCHLGKGKCRLPGLSI